MYVADERTNTICVFSCDGDLLFQFGAPEQPPVPYFLTPVALCIDCNDKVYVGSKMFYILVFDEDGACVKKIGSRGSDPGQFGMAPKPLCIDRHRGLLYAGDEDGERVQIFNIGSD